MISTTLCYIEKDNKYLMLHRVKKENDANHDKWIGVGGKFETGESPEECLLREVKEETGLTLTKYRLRGIVTFVSDEWEGEYMYLFTATEYEGEIKELGIEIENEIEKTSKVEIESEFKTESNLLSQNKLEKMKEPKIECDEGDLIWVPKSELFNLNLWEGDKIFLKLLDEDNGFFSLKLCYEGEKLVETKLTTY